MKGLRLVDHNPQRPHIQSPAELQAYIKGRLAARERYNEQERERQEAERAAWRDAGARRQRRRQNIRDFFLVLAYVVLVVGAVILLWPR